LEGLKIAANLRIDDRTQMKKAGDPGSPFPKERIKNGSGIQIPVGAFVT